MFLVEALHGDLRAILERAVAVSGGGEQLLGEGLGSRIDDSLFGTEVLMTVARMVRARSSHWATPMDTCSRSKKTQVPDRISVTPGSR